MAPVVNDRCKKGQNTTMLDYPAAMRALVRSVDRGSFSKAAAAEGVKVSTVSRLSASMRR
jgi:hypothetical protein